MSSRVVIALGALACAIGLGIAVAGRWSNAALTVGTLIATLAVIGGWVYLASRGSRASRALFASSLRAEGAAIVALALTRTAMFESRNGYDFPVVLAAFPDRLEIWKWSGYSSAWPGSGRAVAWADVLDYREATGSVGLRSGLGLEILTRTLPPARLVFVTDRFFRAPVDPRPIADGLRRLQRQAPASGPATPIREDGWIFS